MRVKFEIIFIVFLFLFASPAFAHKVTVVDQGGSPELDTKEYRVFIQQDNVGEDFVDDAQEAVEKWRSEMATRGITVSVQAGDPPQEPLDLDKLNEEVKKFNEADNPDINDYPEIMKADAKRCTVMVYFEKTEDIQKRAGSKTAKGLAKNIWTINDEGTADKIESSDVFLPTDPPGGTKEIRKKNIHNIFMHEFGHVSGLDHYTKSQKGEVMESDATLFTERLEIGAEDKKGLDTLYGPRSSMLIRDSANEVLVASLPSFIQDEIPDDLTKVWEYAYDVEWLSGAPVSYLQVDTRNTPIYAALGSNGLEDWLFDAPSRREDWFLDFYADQNYLGDNVFSGRLQFYTENVPRRSRLIYSGDTVIGLVPTPVPEPITVLMFTTGLIGISLRNRFR